jgi:citronellol/citronellal dehydrogenase
MTTLANKTLFISGASRGIGKAIALRAAADGANIVIAAKTDTPHARLEGTIHSAAAEVEAAGGKALALVVDIRHEEQVQSAMAKAAEVFGGIDILVNNASAIALSDTPSTVMKRFDLMHQVNVRGTFVCTQAALPYLEKAQNPHVLTLCPPISLEPRWFAQHLAYTMSKFGMSMCVIGHAAEFAKRKIAVNGLWPRTTIATAAIEMLMGQSAAKHSRKPEIVADAAHWILTQPSDSITGQLLIDEDVLKRAGVADFSAYANDPTATLYPDLFLELDGSTSK